MDAECAEGRGGTPLRAGVDLFLISLFLLFLELACIRWFPAHVLYLTFFTNVVLLASFLGMSIGCLAAGRSRHYLAWTPLFLTVALAGADVVEYLQRSFEKLVDVGDQKSPQLVFFGTEYHLQSLAGFAIPIEVLGGLFFLVLALVFIGPGQELGRAINRLPDRVLAYTINILGSVAGILLFAGCSWAELSPVWWFLLVALGLGYFLLPRFPPGRFPLRAAALALLLPAMVALAAVRVGRHSPEVVPGDRQLWSPYYRIDYDSGKGIINVNLIGHQLMLSTQVQGLAYALPHLLNRDTGGRPFQNVLIIGAGSGNDVSQALLWSNPDVRIDAVEIDPVIQRLGAQDHPDQPYQDARVAVHLDDGRNFLRATDRKYDLIIYALVDSLVLHSGYSNIRLESYLFTRQAFEDVRQHLKPDGLFVMYNFFRQGWIVTRLYQGLEEVFGEGNPLVLTLPYAETVHADDVLLQGEYAFFLSHHTAPLHQAFGRQPEYWVHEGQAGPQAPNGFAYPSADERRRWRGLSGEDKGRDRWWQLGPARVPPPAEPLRTASDDWPFLYLRRPMIPDLSLRGMLIMGGLAAVLIYLFLPRGKGKARSGPLDGTMFFLGAGFMLIETKAVVNMALLWGSTWMVNSVVFLAVLLMILAANLLVLKFRPRRVWPFFLGLLAALALNVVVPLDFFLGMSRGPQVAGACLLVFTPVLFAAMIFAVLFGQTVEPDRALGANIAGAMLGGLSEYSSMLVGFQYLVLLAIVYYGLAAVLGAVRGPAVSAFSSAADGPTR